MRLSSLCSSLKRKRYARIIARTCISSNRLTPLSPTTHSSGGVLCAATPQLYLHDLLGTTQKPRSPNRLRGVGSYRGICQAKMEVRCRWRRKLGVADSGESASTLQSVVDMDKHTVFLYSPTITSIYLPPPNTNSAQLESLVRTFINPSATMTISIEQLTASLKKKTAPAHVTEVNNDPPTIFISFKPAIDSSGERQAGAGAGGRQCQSRGQCQLAVVRGVGNVLPVQQQGMDDFEDPGRELGRHYESAGRFLEGRLESELSRPEGLHSGAGRADQSRGLLQQHARGNRRLQGPAAVGGRHRNATALCQQYR